MVAGSARGTGTLEAVSQVRRPGAIDAGIRLLVLRAFENRYPQRAEPRLNDDASERARRPGQLLAPGALADGRDARPNFLVPPGDEAALRQVVGNLLANVLRAYVEALGGRLKVTAEFDDSTFLVAQRHRPTISKAFPS